MRRRLLFAFVLLAACATGQEEVPEGFIGDLNPGPDAGHEDVDVGGDASAGAGGSGGEGGSGGAGGEGGSGGDAGAGGSGGEGGSAGAGGSGGEGGSGGAGGEGGSGGGSAGAGGSGGEGGTGGAGGAGGEGGSGGDAGAGGSGGAGGEPEPPGPVDRGVYSYERVVSYGLVNPPAAAWHSSGSYALVLNTNDKVFLYDQATNSLSEVGSAGSTVNWRTVTFTPDGDKAVLLGNTNSEGRIYIWDHANQALSEMATDNRHAGGTYEAIAYSPDGSQARLLGSTKNGASGYIAYLWPFDSVAGRDKAGVKATTVGSGGVQDMAWATDDYGNPAIVIVGGIGGVTMLHLDFMGNWEVKSTAGLGNTSRLSGRPQGDYALAIGWTSSLNSFHRFERGQWTTSIGGWLPGAYNVSFSTNGRRALVLGGLDVSGRGQVYEYRHDLLSRSEITDVLIPNFKQAPYNADSGTKLHDAAWRPRCDEGLIVGGSSSKGHVIRFTVDNGNRCED